MSSIKNFWGAQSLGIVKGLQSTEKDYNLKNITSRQDIAAQSFMGRGNSFFFICARAVSKMTVKTTRPKLDQPDSLLWLCYKLIHYLGGTSIFIEAMNMLPNP